MFCVGCSLYCFIILFDYNGQLLEHAICLVVLFFCHFIVFVIVFLNEINGDGDGDIDRPIREGKIFRVRKMCHLQQQ